MLYKELDRIVQGNAFEQDKKKPGLKFNPLGPVVWRPISANPGLNFNPRFFVFCSKAFSQIIFF